MANSRRGSFMGQGSRAFYEVARQKLTHFVISRGSFAVLHKAALNGRLSR
jgi:hypothetical protein